MSRSYFWILYAHLAFACFFIGGMTFFSILVANLRKRLTPEEFAGEVVSLLRFYHPFVLLCMGVLIMSGAWYLTGVKVAMGPRFGTIFVPLGLKLGTVFLIVMGLSFQFFGLGLRLTRGMGPAGNGRPPSEGTEERLRLIRAVEKANLFNMLLSLIAVFLGLSMSKGF
ncbi:MAG: hypothetical protein HOC91_05835 [Nitrospinaceae bacterium]|jgi:hypothetical protein|nr:hypothetical protein [Nitrospinaceae bacterium]MBT4094163.1 hypothetical protein [Nitrospinaceae bacterium]MBT4430019.1 hypothetical protein [Nitrospinaceae bacterium]MBT5369563.1 hypothetical protein [Nitrospinaceae bacterium]MBT5946966.1 hypothetical protein [Nitrospinaceae bacterium]